MLLRKGCGDARACNHHEEMMAKNTRSKTWRRFWTSCRRCEQKKGGVVGYDVSPSTSPPQTPRTMQLSPGRSSSPGHAVLEIAQSVLRRTYIPVPGGRLFLGLRVRGEGGAGPRKASVAGWVTSCRGA